MAKVLRLAGIAATLACLSQPVPGADDQGSEAAPIRVRTDDEPVSFVDGLQGQVSQQLERESGDFVVRRRDGLIAYQLAVVVDDELQGITEVVRGIDIMDSTPRQIWLQRLLGYRTPAYVHIPVITHPDGDKLSKLTGAPAIPTDEVRAMLVAALAALRQAPPRNLESASLGEIWGWARAHWTLEPLRGLAAVRADEIPGKPLTVTPCLQ